MDWAKKEVASLELSKKLKELGFPQKEPGWFWCLRKDSEFYDLFFTMDKMYFYKPKQYEEFFIFEYHHLQDYIKAPTNPELGEWLPPLLKIKDFIFFLVITKEFVGGEYEWKIYYAFDEVYSSTILNNSSHWDLTEANARAKTIIWLRKNGYITFNQEDKDNAQSRQQT